MVNDKRSILIEPEQLSACLDETDVLVIAVCIKKTFDDGHIPGSVLIEPSKLMKGEKPAVGKIPSIEELEKRLVSRNQDDKKAIKRRLSAYEKDVTHSKDYDHVIINDKVEMCFKQIKDIILNHLKKNN